LPEIAVRDHLPKRGGRADLPVALSEKEDEQGLRAAIGEWRSFHPRGDELPDGEEIGSLMRVFGQFPSWTLAISK
jgi:hypothetical protein